MIPVPDWSQTATLFPFDLRLLVRPRYIRAFLMAFIGFWITLPALVWGEHLDWLQYPHEFILLFSFMSTPGPPPLLFSHPPTQALIFMIGLTLTPAWVIVLACDQTTSSIRTHFFRFLLPRCGRATLFLSRFLVLSLVVIALQLLVAVSATTSAILLEEASTGQILLFGSRCALSLSIHGVAVTAMMALISAWADTPRTSLFTAILFYGGITQAVNLIAPTWPLANHALYLIPGGASAWLIQPNFHLALVGMGLDLLYALFALWGGWWVFRTRAL